MSMMQITLIAIAGCLLAVILKSLKTEYALFCILACAAIIFFCILSSLSEVITTIREIFSYLNISDTYISILLKMLGITYVAEFASGLCKDSGFSSLASQIEVFGKITILGISMPVVLALFEIIQSLTA